MGLNPVILRQVRAFALAVGLSEPPAVPRRGYIASGFVLGSILPVHLMSVNGCYLAHNGPPLRSLATCHVKPTLTLARGSEVKQEFRRKKSSRRR